MKIRNNCPLCWKVFEGPLYKARQLHQDIQNAAKRGLKEIDYSNLTHTQQKLMMFINDAADDHHYKLLHKYEPEFIEAQKMKPDQNKGE